MRLDLIVGHNPLALKRLPCAPHVTPPEPALPTGDGAAWETLAPRQVVTKL